MFAALAGGLGSLLRTVAPTAINWGMNKIARTGLEKTLAPMMPIIKSFIPQVFGQQSNESPNPELMTQNRNVDRIT